MTTFTTEDRIAAQAQESIPEPKPKTPQSFWNNRVVKITTPYGTDGEVEAEVTFEICEVYYNRYGNPCGYCAASAMGDDTIESLKEVYERMSEAFDNPVLDADTDFKHTFLDDEEGGHEFP